jgi:hypothetical protein
MKYQIVCVFIGAILALNAQGGDNGNDSVVTPTQMHSLESKSRNAKNIDEKRESADALYAFAKTVFQGEGNSNISRPELAAITCESYTRYLMAATSPVDSASNSIAALELALSAVDKSPLPPASLNVSPPEGSPGVFASGMDPKNIQDPKVKAEYELRIARNNQAIAESNNRIRLQHGIDELKEAIGNVIQGSDVPVSTSFKSLIQQSHLPSEIKADLLKDSKR